MAAGRLLGGSGSREQAQPHGGHQHRVPLVSFIKRSSLRLFQPSLHNVITRPELISAAPTVAAHSMSSLRLEVARGSWEGHRFSRTASAVQFRGRDWSPLTSIVWEPEGSRATPPSKASSGTKKRLPAYGKVLR